MYFKWIVLHPESITSKSKSILVSMPSLSKLGLSETEWWAFESQKNKRLQYGVRDAPSHSILKSLTLMISKSLLFSSCWTHLAETWHTYQFWCALVMRQFRWIWLSFPKWLIGSTDSPTIFVETYCTYEKTNLTSNWNQTQNDFHIIFTQCYNHCGAMKLVKTGDSTNLNRSSCHSVVWNQDGTHSNNSQLYWYTCAHNLHCWLHTHWCLK